VSKIAVALTIESHFLSRLQRPVVGSFVNEDKLTREDKSYRTKLEKILPKL
jgi:hypothetical protein